MDDFEKYLGEQMKDEAFRKEWEALHDTEFYDGYEGDPEYVLECEDSASLHIWEGYIFLTLLHASYHIHDCS